MVQNNTRTIAIILLSICAALTSACNGGNIGAAAWSQFHADSQNQGFIGVNSSPAVAPLWKRKVGPVAHSSPVIAADGTVHLGTTDGKLVIVNPDGTIKCTVDLSTGVILSTPAIASNGNIYIVSIREVDSDSYLSTLHSVTSGCESRWSYTFPDVNEVIRGYTSASPKVMESNQGTHIFLPVRLSRQRDSADNDDYEDGLNELFVFDDSGSVIDRRTIGGCVHVSGGGSDISGLLSDIWDIISDFPNGTAVIGDAFGPLYEQFGWLDPTPALVDLSTITQPERPLIIVADNCIGLRMTGFQWRLDLAAPQLNRIWTYDDDSNKRYYSSPAVFNNGLLVIGREDGMILGFDPETGAKLWSQNVGEAVMATPASFGRQIFLNSLHRLHVLEANGEFADVPVVSTYLGGGQTIASPAVSANFVYYGTTTGLRTRSFDFFTRANDSDATGGVSSPAISPEGIVYNVIIEDGSGYLMAYPARAQPQVP
ncbi:PQQ-binding-like beta-propeller repeat protein [Nitrosomonas sp.]|uniref:PQQ-binding-like beta-propeller repeat protein n=1 Tax=Nitrosomonas sp. TaxID=42353 RepID=UPI00284538BC|nr:PQQ-binding-like beta-propeller repeat protein [Nitrosomonas sp.]MDR4515454.1 PQQ-binding-like beta-propeller repeat protein [Nitrosomonas sp.]